MPGVPQHLNQLRREAELAKEREALAKRREEFEKVRVFDRTDVQKALLQEYYRRNPRDAQYDEYMEE
jgi:hypothetical protein